MQVSANGSVIPAVGEPGQEALSTLFFACGGFSNSGSKGWSTRACGTRGTNQGVEEVDLVFHLKHPLVSPHVKNTELPNPCVWSGWIPFLSPMNVD